MSVPTTSGIDLKGVQLSRRADARRNYEALLSAATAAFAQQDDVALEEIARQAGVGIATLYRHFPNRDALVLACYRREVDKLVVSAQRLARSRPPLEALSAWMRRFVAHSATKRGMRSALIAMSEADPHLFADVRALILDTMNHLIDAAAAEQSIPAETDAEDVLRALSGFAMVCEGPGWQHRADRLLQLVLDGLRYRPQATPAAANVRMDGKQ